MMRYRNLNQPSRNLILQSCLAAMVVLAAVWATHRWWDDRSLRPIGEVLAPTLGAKADASAIPPAGVRTDASLASEWDMIRTKILSRFAAGDFETAATLAEEAIERRPNDPGFLRWAKAQYPLILVSAAWTRIRLGDCEGALPLLTRAQGLSPTRESTKGLAYCHYRLKNFAQADEWFSIHLRRHPDDTEMQSLRADQLESEDRFDEAIRALEIASAAPGIDATFKAQLAKHLAALRSRAGESAQQTRVTSPNFTLACRAAVDNETIQNILKTLEQALDEFAEVGLRPPAAPIEVIVYAASTFKSMVADVPAWADGIYDGRIRVTTDPSGQAAPRIDSEPFHRLLRHELVHALLASMSGESTLPTWFQEGLAQRLECAKRCQDSFPFPTPRAAFIPADALIPSFTALKADQARLAYLQSLFLVWTIEDTAGGLQAIRDVTRSIQPGKRLTADTILAPLQMTWESLHQSASERWLGAHLR